MFSSLLDLSHGAVEALQRIPWPVTVAILLNTLIGILGLAWFFLFIIAPVPRPAHPSEKKFKTVNADGEVTRSAPLPCWLDNINQGRRKGQKDGQCSLESIPIEPAELFMSVVVPAFNEEDRLVGMLEEAVNYLEHEYGLLSDKADAAAKHNGAPIRRRASGQTEINAHSPETHNPEAARGWEILLIDDGSTDSTIETAVHFARTHQLPLRPRRNSGPWSHRSDSAVNIPPGSIRLVSLKKNRGKGGAVTHGMRHARGAYVVFADADGKRKTRRKAEPWPGGQALQTAQLPHAFLPPAPQMDDAAPHRRHPRDTQCGFKLFTRSSLPYIIPYMHCEGWIFDVEMLMLAEFAGIPVAEGAGRLEGGQGQQAECAVGQLGHGLGSGLAEDLLGGRHI
ncbi:hypothetical protein EPUS_00309 [Endocarpon pusillum Z07020]|uniref:Glycosyltransferase 2-like domain-containing protein n=1 Tax=Endocarpon pusillum (strain Z07020 / HMAS-L-300199) TaxID=1263415 RepID=U1FYZ5_ENDPU|nr:uncharacterized protein EPUS_00309 [Endocarpon pusillum Z07020]ERF70122.1 hypothetical protein EPUS_00309 [Endocarpon pusillum Z07020]